MPPCAHVFTHYGDCARLFGVLVWYWLMAFERYNKKIKNLVGNPTHPIASLKNSLIRDAGLFLCISATVTENLLTHSLLHSLVASYRRWKQRDKLALCHYGWKARITSDGDLYPMPNDLAVKLQLFGVCTCCSHSSLKVSCTEHKTAEINGVKVLDISIHDDHLPTHSFLLTHSHSHSLSLTHSFTLPLSHSHSYSLTLTHNHSHFRTLSLTHVCLMITHILIIYTPLHHNSLPPGNPCKELNTRTGAIRTVVLCSPPR